MPVSIVDKIAIVAAKKKEICSSNNYMIGHFTASNNDNLIYKKVRSYGSTRMFLVKGSLPDGADGITYSLTGCRDVDKKKNEVFLMVKEPLLRFRKEKIH